MEPTSDTLREVIAASPVRALPASYWWVRVDAPSPATSHLAVVTDGVETTVVTSDHETVERGPVGETEGPFACFRLEISIPFGGPGFIAAATSACAARGVNVCVISTFSFDYLFVPLPDRGSAVAALADAGFPIAD